MGKSILHSLKASRKPSSSCHGLLLLGRSSERKRLLKMCVRKLQSIDDPETFLCRSVLINNTLKTLQTVQREARAKKDAREQQMLLSKSLGEISADDDSQLQNNSVADNKDSSELSAADGGDSSALSSESLSPSSSLQLIISLSPHQLTTN